MPVAHHFALHSLVCVCAFSILPCLQVFRAALQGMTSHVALKVISCDGESDMRRRALRELSHLRDFRHSNILRCYGACLWENDIAIAMELMPRGTLYAALASRHVTWGTRFVAPPFPPVFACM